MGAMISRIPPLLVPMVLFLAGMPAHAFPRLFPDTPRDGQEFVFLTNDNEGCVTPGTVRSEVSGSRITLSYQRNPSCASGSLNYVMTVLKLSAGTYQVVERGEVNGVATANQDLGSITVLPAATVGRTTTNLDGMWYVPSQPGWGVSITEGESGQLFLGWYLYGVPVVCCPVQEYPGTWYFASSGSWITPSRFVAPFYSSSGGKLAGTTPLASIGLFPLGTLTVDVNVDGTVKLGALFLPKGTTFEATLTRFRF